MLGFIAKKGKDFVYVAEWLSKDKTSKAFFRFGIVADDNLQKESANYLKGYSGQMQIKTLSTLRFMPEDIVVIRGSRYSIINVDGNRKEQGEQAQARFETNGNIVVYLTLRKAGQ